MKKVALVGLAVGALATTALTAGQTQPRDAVTFTKDIAPILQRSCQSCHNPGGIGPMPLLTFEQARPWARSIKLKTSRREMPPWFIEKNIGIQRFKDDPSLTDAEVDKIAKWVDNGAPQGNPADLPPGRQRVDAAAWSIGTPDLIVSSPVLTIKPVAADFMTDIGPSPTRLTEERYIRAIEVKEVSRAQKDTVAGQSETVAAPSENDLNYFLVHHASISIDQARQEDTADSTVDARSEGGNSRRLVFYQMGQNATIYPEGVGALLPAGSALKFAIHVHSVGQPLPLRLDVAFRFYPIGYKPKYVLSSFSASPRAQHEELDIPAGQDNIRIDGYTPVPRPMKLVTFVPHLHANGKRMCIEAIYQDGRTEMLNCAGWNHNWSKLYFYDDDVAPLLPAGTLIHTIAWFDNTAANPRNIEPRNWKGYGNRTVDDMSFFLPEVVYLTDEQFKAEAAARALKKR